MNFQKHNFIEQIKSVLDQPLPGRAAQLKMSTSLPQYQKQIETPANVRVAAVLAHFHYDQEWKLTLMERTKRGPHSGQISFPGGRVEEQDSDLIGTALREAHEEVGILPKHVEILGKLSSLYIPVSNSLVHPFVGYSKQSPDYKLEPEEVESLIVASFTDFFNPDKLKSKNLTVGNGFQLKDVPYFDINDHVVWGATAMMMSELLVAIQQHQKINS